MNQIEKEKLEKIRKVIDTIGFRKDVSVKAFNQLNIVETFITKMIKESDIEQFFIVPKKIMR